MQLRRRADLVPNLVETVKAYAAHERGVLEDVAAARLGHGGDRRARQGRRGSARCKARSAACSRWRRPIRS